MQTTSNSKTAQGDADISAAPEAKQFEKNYEQPAKSDPHLSVSGPPTICCVDELDEVTAETRGTIRWRPMPGLDLISPFCFVLLHELIRARKIDSLLVTGRGDFQDLHLISADLARFIEEVSFLLVDREEVP